MHTLTVHIIAVCLALLDIWTFGNYYARTQLYRKGSGGVLLDKSNVRQQRALAGKKARGTLGCISYVLT